MDGWMDGWMGREGSVRRMRRKWRATSLLTHVSLDCMAGLGVRVLSHFADTMSDPMATSICSRRDPPRGVDVLPPANPSADASSGSRSSDSLEASISTTRNPYKYH